MIYSPCAPPLFFAQVFMSSFLSLNEENQVVVAASPKHMHKRIHTWVHHSSIRIVQLSLLLLFSNITKEHPLHVSLPRSMRDGIVLDRKCKHSTKGSLFQTDLEFHSRLFFVTANIRQTIIVNTDFEVAPKNICRGRY